MFSCSAFSRPRSVGENIKFYESCNYFRCWGTLIGRAGNKILSAVQSLKLLSNRSPSSCSQTKSSVHSCMRWRISQACKCFPKPHTKLKIIKITKSLIRFMSYSIDMEMEVMSKTGEDWLWNIQHQNMHNPN